MTYVKRFSASSAAQLMACPGSARLEEAIPGFVMPAPDPLKFKAKGVGTKVHSVLELYVSYTETPWILTEYEYALLTFSELHHTRRKRLADDAPAMRAWLDKDQLHGIDELWMCQLDGLTPKMLRWMAAVADYLRNLFESLRPGDVVMAEEQLVAEWLPSKPGTTPDITVVGRDRLEVVDLKSGAIPVDPMGNDQLLFYAACKLHLAPRAEEVRLHVLQPGPRDEWNNVDWYCSRDHLEGWMRRAVEADERILAGSLELVNNDHCTFCPANPWSRGEKGNIMCPVRSAVLYPESVPDIDELASA